MGTFSPLLPPAFVAGILSALLLIAGCATSTPRPEPFEVSDSETIEATVTAVDAGQRRITLRGPRGDSLTLRAGPEMRNFAQIEAGDVLRVRYDETYRVSLAAPGTSQSGTRVAAARSAEGERPGAQVAAQSITTVEIVAVAVDGTSVSFRDEAGQLQSMRVVREQGQAFARGLQRGDLVDLEFTGSIAIEVAPADEGG